MATEDTGSTVAGADVTAFALKLDAWARGLTPAEQALLERLLSRAAEAPDDGDTRGYIIIQNGLIERGIILQSLGLNPRGFEPGGGIERLIPPGAEGGVPR